MPTTDQPPKSKRRWYQFSLLTLLLVMLLFCFGFAWIGWRMRQARENRDRVATSEKEIEQAVAEIEHLGAVVTSSHVELRPQTWLEEQFDDPGGVDDPVRILAVTGVKLWGPSALFDPELFRRQGKVTDAGMAHLKKLKALETLDLYRSNITDAGLEHVRGSKRLKFLTLQSTDITDAGLEHLRGLTELQTLDLVGTGVTDAGMEHLKGLTKLQELDLAGTGVSDAGLEHLKALTKLKRACTSNAPTSPTKA